jgi:hypothetical protein
LKHTLRTLSATFHRRWLIVGTAENLSDLAPRDAGEHGDTRDIGPGLGRCVARRARKGHFGELMEFAHANAGFQ